MHVPMYRYIHIWVCIIGILRLQKYHTGTSLKYSLKKDSNTELNDKKITSTGPKFFLLMAMSPQVLEKICLWPVCLLHRNFQALKGNKVNDLHERCRLDLAGIARNGLPKNRVKVCPKSKKQHDRLKKVFCPLSF